MVKTVGRSGEKYKALLKETVHMVCARTDIGRNIGAQLCVETRVCTGEKDGSPAKEIPSCPNCTLPGQPVSGQDQSLDTIATNASDCVAETTEENFTN